MKMWNYRSQSYNISQRKVYETERQVESSTRRVKKADMITDGST